MRLLFCLSTLLWLLAKQPPARASLPQATSQQAVSPVGVGAAVGESDVLVVPDGTPVRVRVIDRFSSFDSKVGDIIHYEVFFDVRVDGLVVLPQGTMLTAKIVSITRPGRGMKDARVGLVYDSTALPTGDAATLRAVLKAKSKGAKIGETTATAAGDATTVFITGGVALLAFGFGKGDELNIDAGTVIRLYLNGPLKVSRKAVVAAQPAPGSGYAILDLADYYSLKKRKKKDTSVPQLFCGQKLLPRPFAGLLLAMPPGSYAFTTDGPGDHAGRVQLSASHVYSIYRDKQGTICFKELREGWLPDYKKQNFAKAAYLDFRL